MSLEYRGKVMHGGRGERRLGARRRTYTHTHVSARPSPLLLSLRGNSLQVFLLLQPRPGEKLSAAAIAGVSYSRSKR